MGSEMCIRDREVSVQTGSATYYQPLDLSVTIDSTSGMKIVDATAAVSFNRDLLTFTGLSPGPLTPSWSLGYTIKTGTSNMDTLLLDLSGDSFSDTGTFLEVGFGSTSCARPSRRRLRSNRCPLTADFPTGIRSSRAWLR